VFPQSQLISPESGQSLVTFPALQVLDFLGSRH